jgi:transcriptional regulator with XRE-family HTH domain
MNGAAQTHSPFGGLLRHWRIVRGFSQLALAIEADISTRHLSFLETGRAQPSRAMVELLAGMLDVPLSERNTLLLAAGFAPAYDRRPLSAPDLQPLQRAIDFILKQQEPYPAVVIDGASNILRRNQASQRVFGLFADPVQGLIPNTIRTMFHPRGIRQYVVNWHDMAVRMLYRLHHDAAAGTNDAVVRLREEVMSYPGVESLWNVVDVESSAPALRTMKLRKGEWSFAFFFTVSTIGMPCDVSLEGLRVMCFFPADNATDEAVHRMANQVRSQNSDVRVQIKSAI